MTKTYLMNSLIEKMQSPDQDFRFMGLNDLMTEIRQDPSSFSGDEQMETKVLNQVLALVEDKISEVKNQAVKCLGQLIKIIREPQLENVVDKLIEFSGGKDDELRDISALALKTITAELPSDGKVAVTACSKLAPKLLGQIQNTSTPSETLVETLSILSILIVRFPSHLTSATADAQPLRVIAPLLVHTRPVVRKRAIITLSQFIPLSQPQLFTELLQTNVYTHLVPDANIEKQKTTVQLVAAVARHSPLQIAPVLNDIAVQRDDDELREGCLQALEAIVLRCPNEATPYLSSFHSDWHSDDEDQSYKIRRSSTKLLSALITTRPELLTSIYKDVSPVLISRFGDREDTVKLEVWATYVILLNQTAVYGGFSKEDTACSREAKARRRNYGSQVPSLSKALLNQIKSPKTPAATLQAGFGLLHSLLDVLPGSLSSQVPLIITTSKSVLSQSLTSSTATLHLTCLSFLALFFGTHSPATFSGSLPSVTPVLLKLLGERHPRVSSETFRVSLKPVKGADWTEPFHDTDAENKDQKEWEAICRTTGKTEGGVKVIIKVAREVSVGDNWVNGCLGMSGRSGKTELFTALDVLVKRSRPFSDKSNQELHLHCRYSLLSQALNTLSILLQLTPATSFPEIEKTLLSEIYLISYSPLVSGAALDSLLNFYSTLVQADNQIATHVVPNLVLKVEKAPKAETSPSNVAKCVAQVVKSQHGIAAGVIAEYSKHLKQTSKAKPSLVVLSLLILGELGRFIDMSPQTEIFSHAIELFSSDQEDLRAAAAFAAGNIAIGNLHLFLPAIIKMVESDPKKRLLSLHALKEVVTHSSQSQLESVSDLLWVPLFENSENSEETTRNVAAACLGKLAITHPSRYLPQLHARIQDENPATRATVVSAIRYTFADSPASYDELLSPYLVDFLSLMLDQDLTVRRIALSALNSAARTKPHLVRDHLSALLSSLYKETTLNPQLVRTVQMGPWTHKVDDGLETRKTAYETMYTLLDTCLTKIDLHEFLGRVIPGLTDESDEIKVISHMMLFRLAQVAPAAVSQRLDEAAPPLEKTMKGATVTKDTVKQDLERAAELQRSALRAVAALSKIGAGVSPKFDNLVEELKKNPSFSVELKELGSQ
ncbi:armadillo-type protein [Desarmillaria tabescens]|uniref:Armadillo-type protein n=1 Tax=Armillaria tabescens TaxID=1929756 RepID=A0AA39JSA6_ARMTA|nr:armadillo-type protein [Desarmillaria tabescens]KAK0446544.1 armadillo-type protein [Desarmillaria tabescens]